MPYKMPNPLEVGQLIDAFAEAYLHNDYDGISTDCAPDEDRSNPLDELAALRGLDEVKAEVYRQLSYHRIMQRRAQAGLRVPERTLHLILTGNPGSGKTTVARLIARIYADAGLIASDKFIETSRAKLVGQYIGETEKNTLAAIEEARGGVLFIDEMYALTQGAVEGNSRSNDFGPRVIDTLMPLLSDPRADIMVIGAGYADEMRKFITTNTGLSSRFPTVLHFPDYDADTLMDIAVDHLAAYDFTFDDDSLAAFRSLIDEGRRNPLSGNARLVITALDNHVIPNLCQRIDRIGTEPSPDDMRTIRAVDVPPYSAIGSLDLPRRAARVGF